MLFQYFITLIFHFKFFLLPRSVIFASVNILLGFNFMDKIHRCTDFFGRECSDLGWVGVSAVIRTLFGFVNPYEILDNPLLTIIYKHYFRFEWHMVRSPHTSWQCLEVDLWYLLEVKPAGVRRNQQRVRVTRICYKSEAHLHSTVKLNRYIEHCIAFKNINTMLESKRNENILPGTLVAFWSSFCSLLFFCRLAILFYFYCIHCLFIAGPPESRITQFQRCLRTLFKN